MEAPLPEMKRLLVMTGSGGRVYMKCKDDFKLNLKVVVAKMRDLVKDIPGMRISVSQSGIFTRRGQSTGKSINMRVEGKDLHEVQKYVDILEEGLAGVEGVLDAQSSLDVSNPEFQIRIDREKAAKLGLSVRTVAEAIETLVGGKGVSLYRSGGEEIDITRVGDCSAPGIIAAAVMAGHRYAQEMDAPKRDVPFLRDEAVIT